MSEHYYIVRKIINKYHKKEYKFNLYKKIIISLYILSVSILVISILHFQELWGKIGVGVGSILLGIFIVLFFKELKKIGKKNRLIVVQYIKNGLSDYDIKSISIIQTLISEIDERLNKIDQEKNIIFKRIVTIFVSVFWIPFGFITKKFFDSLVIVDSFNKYIEIVLGLFSICGILIGFAVILSVPIDAIFKLEKPELIFIRNYLLDVKYEIMKEEKNYQRK